MNNTRDNIRALSDREKAREKLPIFYGSFDNFYHGFKEILNNSVDEILNNFDKGTISITLSDDNRTISVKDTGRGMPIDTYEQAKLLFETLFASGKYDVTENTNSGVNGVGGTILQFSSKYFRCTSNFQRKVYQITYENGGDITQELTCLGETDSHGTEITFTLDDTCYTQTIYDPNEIEDIIRKVSLVSKNITFNYTYKNETKTFNNTIEEYFDLYATDIIGNTMYCNSQLYKRNIEVEREGRKQNVVETADIQVVLGTCVGENLLQETMLNGNYLKDNGTIYDGVIDGIKLFVNRHCKNNGLIKNKDKNITNQDIESAVSFVCRLFSNIVEFESQVKFATKKEYYKDVAKHYIQEQLEIYKEENKKDFDRLVQQILICKKANETNEKAKQVLKKKLTEKTDSINNRVEGFVDCEVDSGGELFLTEGLSALGSIVLARNSYNQAAYPLRGKLINVLKNPIEKVFKNDEILDIINLLGTGVEFNCKFTKDLPKFNLNNLRWDKIICTADADSDGKQINVLILTALYKLVPSIITNGYVYIAQSPLFEIKVSDEEKYYALSEAERDIKISELKDKKYEIHRLKGLGEVSKEVMYDTVCNPETRVLQKVTVEDIEKMIDSFNVWMDRNISDRKEYIENNLHKYLVEPPIEDITPSKNIEDIVYDNMMEYSAETIFDRAISSVESGLKPSQLKSLWTMYVNKVTKLTKSLNVAGAVTAYHEHGSVYPTIVNMCQEDRHTQPLIIGEGNFGNYTSKQLTAASDRYTNIKLSDIALDGLKEIDKRYVEMIPTYDNKKVMPLYLPSKYPIILTQATNGMAVGMASTMPSFNFNEVCNAIDKYIVTGEKDYLIPDFATYGYIENNNQVIKNINENGYGSLKLRGKCIKEGNSIIITEVPYGTFREDIVDKIIELVKDNRLKEVISVKDLTGLKGLKIKIECRKNTNLDMVIEKLYKLTNLESTYSCNMNVLYKGMPKVRGVWDIIDCWIEFRKECIANGIKYECKQLSKELHLLYGIKNILIDIEKAINIIRFSEHHKEELMNTFNLDDIQVEYILKLTLRDINKTFISKKISKIDELEKTLSDKKDIITNNSKLLNIVLEDIRYISNKFKTPRRTQIVDMFAKSNDSIEDMFIEDYNLNIVLSSSGYMKKVRLTSLRGASEYRLKDGDTITSIRQTSNKSDLLIFTTKQNCYKVKTHTINDHKPSALGLYLPSHLQLSEDEEIIDIIPTTDYKEEILIAYVSGRVARVPLTSFVTKTNRTKLSNSLNNEKVVAIHIYEEAKYILRTNDKALIFKSKNIPIKTTRHTQGVIVMKHANMGDVIGFKKISDCTIETQSRYIGGKAGKLIKKSDII